MARIVKKAEERRREIISASRDLFLEKGYENTSLQDIMTKLQIAKGTTYHYFKSKEELLEAVIGDMVNEYIAGLEKALNGVQGNALNKIQILFSAGKVDQNQPKTIENLHRRDNIEMHVRLLALTLTRLAPLYARVISQGCEEGLFKTEHPLECAEMMLAGIQFITDIGCYPWSQEELERRTRAIPVLIENQLQAPKDAFNFLNDK